IKIFLTISGKLDVHNGGCGMNRRILVTGANGFIGSRVIRKLISENDVPIILKRSGSDMSKIKNVSTELTYYDVDITPIEEIFAMEKIDAIINLATYYRKHNSYCDIVKMIETNVEFPTKLMELCVKNEVPLFITAGSYFQYDINSVHFNENTPLIARDLYAATKNALQTIMDYYSSINGLTTLDLLLFTPYGEMDHEEKLIPYLIKQALRKESVKLSYGFQKLNLVYIEDVAMAFVKALDVTEINTQRNLRIILANKQSYSIREIVTIVEDLLDNHIDVKWASLEMDVIDRNFDLKIDTELSDKILGWHPEIDIYEGLRRTIKYYSGDTNEH
ncbi:NAD-dependent epimerase/dehydratase, partial [mine drainage metagenome]